MEKAHFKDQDKRKSFFKMGFFYLFVFVLGCAVGSGNTLAGAENRERTAVQLPYTRTEGRREEFHEFEAYKNLPYPSSYPNHYYDAFLFPKDKRKEALGTIIYVHGGGFVSGTKDIVQDNPYFLKWLRSGFQVISVDYALAPDYPYPTALYQLSYCVQKLFEEKESLGINTKKLIFVADSAGASLAGQFILTQVNKSYSKKLDIPSFVSKKGGKICAFISLSGLLDCTRYHKTGLAENDKTFLSWGRQYFQELSFYNGKKAEQTKLENYLTKDFPPTFLSDGNVGTFRNQAIDFKERCVELGIPVVSYFPDSSLPHDYELHMDSQEAEESLEKQIRFVKFLLS